MNVSTTNTTTSITIPRFTLRPLPIVTVRPILHNLAVLDISDSTAKKAVDEKMNAALKNFIKKEIDIEDDVLEKRIDALKLDYRQLLDSTLFEVITTKVIPDIKREPKLAYVNRILSMWEEDDEPDLIRDLLDIDLPLNEHPLFVTDVRQSKGLEILRIAKLGNNLMNKIDVTGKKMEAWSEQDWADAVSSKRLTTAQKDALFYQTELSRICGENYELVDAVNKAGLKSISDLVKWTKTEWLDLIVKKKITLPEDMTADAYATLIVGNVQQSWMHEYFAEHISRKAWAQTAPRLWKNLQRLLKNNPDLLNLHDTADIDWTLIKATEQKSLTADLNELIAIINTYRHLGIGELITGKKTMEQQRTEIGRRIDALARFFKNNPNIDLRLVNLLEPATESRSTETAGDNKLNWTGIAAADKTSVNNQLMAYQRVMHLSEDYDSSIALLHAGYDASSRISGGNFNAFSQKTGLTSVTAKNIFNKATERAARIAHGIQLKKDAISYVEQDRYYQGVNPSFVNDLKDIAGYADLFGNTNYCECEHCSSIFSPAAYFTDLMYFIETNITRKAFVGKKNHPLRLNKRRPDLWTVPLTCENTDTLIPQLTLVNEILQQYLKNSLNVNDSMSAIAVDRRSIGLPYNHALQSVRAYLSDWNTSLPEIYALLNVPTAVQDKELLHFSDQEWTGMIASGNDIAWIHFDTSNHSKMDVVDFLRYADLSRNELEELRTAAVAGGFSIDKVKLSNDIQSEKEVVSDLSDSLLNRMGRFLRLKRSTRYGIAELDEILSCKNIVQANKFSAASLKGLARFVRLQQQTGLATEQLIAVLEHIPVRALKSGDESLYEKIGFPEFTGAADFPVKFHHAHFNTDDAKDASVDDRLPALLSMFGLNDAELLYLFKLYAPAFSFKTNGNCDLTAANLDLLYAHVTLARAWHFSQEELGLLISTLFNQPEKVFHSLAQFESLVAQVALVQRLPFDIYELVDLKNGAMNLVSEDDVIQGITNFQQTGARLFSLTTITAIQGITTSDANTIIENLKTAGLVINSGDKFALTSNYTSATNITNFVPAELSAFVPNIHSAFLAYQFINLLPNVLAAITGLTPELCIVALAYVELGWENTNLLTALLSPVKEGVAQQPADLVPLIQLSNQLKQIGFVFDRCEIQVQDAWFIAQYPDIIGIKDIQEFQFSDFDQLMNYQNIVKSDVSAMQNVLWQYQVRSHNNQVINAAQIFSITISALPVFAKAISAGSTVFVKADVPDFTSEAVVDSRLNEEEVTLFAKLTQRDFTVLRSVFISQVLPVNAVDGIVRSIGLYDFCSLLRVQAHSLGKLLKRDVAGLALAEKMLLSTLKDKYPDATTYTKQVSLYSEQLNMELRDALCNYIIARADLLKFKDREDLYNYFLIDVEMGGCFETSCLVAAISSLQQYVVRCLVDLEQSKNDNLAVLSMIDAETISQEWEWRKNYRVWEANRKVFLYPENYIEPDLRDNKTPLFQELEENLMQRKITLPSAEEAYTRYLSGFSELGQLKISGVYYDKAAGDESKQTYYFFGRTHADPYQYYFRRYFVKAKRWEAWQRVELSISAPYVAPIVHLGRLYIFWSEATTAEKTGFLDGNSIFQGIEHQITVQYSHLTENNKWTVPQKRPFNEKFLDRHFVDITPPFIKLMIDKFMFVTIDKSLTKVMSDMYQKTKTFPKIFVTFDNPNELEELTIHYFRERTRSNICVVTTTVEKKKNGQYITVDHYKAIKENSLNNFYVVVKDGKVGFDSPKVAPAFQHFRKTLNLVRNEFTAFFLLDRMNQTSEDVYYDASNGIETIGFHSGTSQGNIPYLQLVLRNYAVDSKPAPTDSMLISDQLQNGKPVSSTVHPKHLHDIFTVANRQSETILQVWKNQHWLRRNFDNNVYPHRTAVRLNTTLTAWLSEILFTQGLEAFLTYETQSTKGEQLLFIDTNDKDQLKFETDLSNQLPFAGAHGEYYRELFFHIPFLIANQLNAEGQYKEAKHWYEKIFNPTAKPIINDSNEKHRVWQYLEFRDLEVSKLKDILSNKETIQAYHDDPFNPHAIARLRMSAYQKTIVMKYVDNLIDWADDLFSKDTMESINEATMLYVLAQDILGKKPVSTGPCETADQDSLTYAKLEPSIEKGSEFLMYVENLYLQFELESHVRSVEPAMIGNQINPRLFSNQLRSTGLGVTMQNYRIPARSEHFETYSARKSSVGLLEHPIDVTVQKTRPETALMRQYLPAFCVPANDTLLGYWDRIADRLFKIRNCMNINGEHRSLALFQPPIDPMLLVRARAAGLSIEEILGQLNEALPPYRFSYFIEKARQYLSTVQSFGSAMLQALEKKDGESLVLLRAVHEENILAMTRSVKKQHVTEANLALQGLYSTKQNVQNRVDYYTGLLSVGLNNWEQLEQTTRHGATLINASVSVTHMMAAIFRGLPNVGSPFAMTYGGEQLGSAARMTGVVLQTAAETLNNISTSAGIAGHNSRRTEEWNQQLKLATEELNQVNKQIAASEIRIAIAEKELEIHEKQIEQAKALHDFYKNKFTNYGLYNYMATQLGRLYREAYQMAAQIARQAERAYQFERDSTDFFIQGDNWQSDKSGLLSGERLALQLQRLEKAYMEQNYRELEISQSFSLLQFNPQALGNLQRTGKCDFNLDELLFDLYYPGHYRRLIKSVRITIPCVTGPYTNIGAKLILKASRVRRTPQIAASLIELPVTMTNSIATSQAQNDAGVFELSFRDERYLPFEGAGAISDWSLSLPSNVRMFNYDSLSDVIIHVSYIAKHDGAFADAVELKTLTNLKQYSSDNGLYREISLRHEFPDTFYQLMNPPVGNAQHSSFTLEHKHFPFSVSDLDLRVASFDVWVKPVKGETFNAASLGLKIVNKTVGSWNNQNVGSVGNLNLVPFVSWDVDAAMSAADRGKVDDVVILVRYKIN